MDTNHFIMKRMISIISAFCLGLFVSVAIIACADGTNDTPPYTTIIDCNCIPTIVSYDETGLYGDLSYSIHRDFTYDENGRIVSGTFVDGASNRPFNVEYTKNSVIVVVEDIDQKLISTFELKEEDMANPKATNAVIYLLCF